MEGGENTVNRKNKHKKILPVILVLISLLLFGGALFLGIRGQSPETIENPVQGISPRSSMKGYLGKGYAFADLNTDSADAQSSTLAQIPEDTEEQEEEPDSQDEEVTEEFVDSTNKRQYVKINGVKSYKENDGSWYTNLNGEKIRDSNHGNTNKSGKQYYIEAYNFTKWVKNNNIAKLTPQDAVYENGEKIDSKGKSIADNLGWRQ